MRNLGTYDVALEHKKSTMDGTSLSPALLNYVEKFCAKLYAGEEVESKAVGIIRKSSTKDLRNKEPRGVSAAAVYLASNSLGKRITQREVAKVAGVTEATIRNRYKEMLSTIGQG
jgi:transcription initiation factor TFIIB